MVISILERERVTEKNRSGLERESVRILMVSAWGLVRVGEDLKVAPNGFFLSVIECSYLF